jgi:hypothetical protein
MNPLFKAWCEQKKIPYETAHKLHVLLFRRRRLAIFAISNQSHPFAVNPKDKESNRLAYREDAQRMVDEINDILEPFSMTYDSTTSFHGSIEDSEGNHYEVPDCRRY